MKIKVRGVGDLTKLIGTEIIVEMKEKANLEDLISQLSHLTKTYRKDQIGNYKVGSDLIILLNGRNINTIKKTLSLHNGDVVTVLPFMVGG